MQGETLHDFCQNAKIIALVMHKLGRNLSLITLRKKSKLKKMLFIVTIEEIHDQEMYADYISQVVKIIRAHEGEYIARSNKLIPFSSDTPERCIIIAFDSIEKARACFLSKEYNNIKHLRENSTKSRAFFIENE